MQTSIANSSFCRRLIAAVGLICSLPVLADTVGEHVAEEAATLSEQWAYESSQHLARGERKAAIAAALKGFPANITDNEIHSYPAAYLALYSAVHADVGRFPLTESHAHITALSPDRRRAVKRSENADGGRIIELLDLTGDTAALLISDQESHSAYSRYDPQVFSTDGQYLLVGSEDGQVLFFDPEDGSLSMALPGVVQASAEGPYPYFLDFVFSPSGNRLAVLQKNPVAITVWDLDTNMLALQWTAERLNALAKFPRGQAALLSANFSDDTNLCLGILSVNFQDLTDSFLALARANVDTEDILHVDTLDNATAMPDINITCSYDQRHLAASYSQYADDPGHYHILKVWSLPEAKLLHTEQNAAVIGFDSESQYLAAHTPAQALFIDIDDLSKVDYPYGPAGFSPQAPVIFGEQNARHYVTTTTQSTLHHFNRYLWKRLPMGIALIDQAENELDEQALASVSADRAQYQVDLQAALTDIEATSRQWALRSSQLLAAGERQEAIAAALQGIPRNVQDDNALAQYPDAYRALYAAVASRSVKLPISGQEGWGYFSVSPDRRRVLLTKNYPTPPLKLELWDVNSGQRIVSLFDDVYGDIGYHPVPFTFSDNGRLIAAGGGNGVLLFNAGDGDNFADLEVFPGNPNRTQQPRYAQQRVLMYNLRFNADGSRLMALSKSGINYEIRIWDVGEVTEVASVFLDSDIRQIAGLSEDQYSIYTNWTDDDQLCLIMTHYTEDGGEEHSTIVIGLLDPITRAFHQYGKLYVEGQSFDRTMGCRADGSVIGVAHAPRQSNQAQASFWQDDGQDDAFFSHQVHSGFIVFDPESEHVALAPQFVDNEAWTFLNLADRSVTDPPFPVADYTPLPPTVYTSDGRGLRPFLVPANHAHWIWPQNPTGIALIEMGLAELDDELRQHVATKRAELE